MAMHGRNERGGSTFDMTLDADYRTAGDNAVWVIGTRPRPIPKAATSTPAIPRSWASSSPRTATPG
jgi:hypothetical protein